MEPEKGSERNRTGRPKQNGRILRAADVIPGPDAASNRKPHSIQKASVKTARPELVNKAPKGGTASSGNSLPTFDLAEEIMAEQRKISAAKRKRPGAKINDTEQLRQSAEAGRSYSILNPPQSEKIITEIVARDIEGFCKSD